MNLQARIEAYAEAADCMDDATLGKIFRKLIAEVHENRQRISEQNRANAKKRYANDCESTNSQGFRSAKTCDRSDSQCESLRPQDFAGVSQCENDDSQINTLPPTPPISLDNIYINNNINNKDSPVEIAVNSSNKNKFVKPTIEEVAAYCKEQNYKIDAEEFVAFYEMRGWKLKGNLPMKSWKGAVVTWEKKRRKDGAQNGYSPGQYRGHNQTAENRAKYDYSKFWESG